MLMLYVTSSIIVFIIHQYTCHSPGSYVSHAVLSADSPPGALTVPLCGLSPEILEFFLPALPVPKYRNKAFTQLHHHILCF